MKRRYQESGPQWQRRVIAAVQRGDAVADDDLRRALGLRPYPRMPLWERALRQREHRAEVRSTIRPREIA